MSDWWKGKALDQSTHARINAANYPGTRQLCCECDQPTGRCEEDSIFHGEVGPLCESCRDEKEAMMEKLVLNPTPTLWPPEVWQSEVERRDEIINSDKQVIADLMAENTKLREALGPFIKHADYFGKDWMDGDELAVTPFMDDERLPAYVQSNTLLFTLKVSDFRAKSGE